jgi:hypothetical protein
MSHRNETISNDANGNAAQALGGLAAAGDPTVLGAAVNDKVSGRTNRNLATNLNDTLSADMTNDESVKELLKLLSQGDTDDASTIGMGDDGDDDDDNEGDENDDGPDAMADTELAGMLGDPSDDAVPVSKITPALKAHHRKIAALTKTVKAQRKVIKATQKAVIGSHKVHQHQIDNMNDSIESILQSMGQDASVKPAAQTLNDAFDPSDALSEDKEAQVERTMAGQL